MIMLLYIKNSKLNNDKLVKYYFQQQSILFSLHVREIISKVPAGQKLVNNRSVELITVLITIKVLVLIY